jgi:D-alanyl-lipoteichoic acid acyltransferase DltB (MBOAT superfamily)
MLFNSYPFIFLFLPITFLVYFYLNKKRLVSGAKIFLIFSSLFFYSWWNIIYLPLIMLSMFFNFFIGKRLNHEDRLDKKKIFLLIGVSFNILLLGYFKYSDFFIENINFVLDINITLLNLSLPLAISFFTFQQIAYLVDSYREETFRYNFLDYSLFVTFFPQLIAGPIVHHSKMMPQFEKNRNKFVNYQNIAMGIFIFSMGLFKKVVIADTFSLWATAGFDSGQSLNIFEAWVTSLSYTFQIYFDFSGYTDMAIGIGLLFNINLPINFNSPYKAKNIQDFWRRWHITLSRFLRDYIYIPLGGSRDRDYRTYINLMITFILGGIWHGAGWTFLFWGFLHGGGLVIHRLWQRLEIRLYGWFAWFVTFNFINITWIFFRANEFSDAQRILYGMFRFSIFSIDIEQLLWLSIGFCLVLYFSNSSEKLQKFKLSYSSLFLTVVLFSISILFLNRVSEFLYFNF